MVVSMQNKQNGYTTIKINNEDKMEKYKKEKKD